MTILTAKCNMRKYLILLVALLAMPRISAAATHYVWCGATGSSTGADFADAYTNLPSSLVRGDTYLIAGSTSCTYATYTFNDAESGTSVITIYKAVDCSAGSNNTAVPYCPGGSAPLYRSGGGPQAAAGWQPGFGTAQAEWTEPALADPKAGAAASPWRFCRSYYTLDGITGNTNPEAGTVGGQGFLLSSVNRNTSGLINVGNSCTETAYTDVTFKHVEITGVDRLAPAAVQTCTWNSGTSTATVTTAATSYPWVVGDPIGGFNGMFGNVTFGADGGTLIATSSGQTITFVPSDPTANPCSTTTYVGLNFGGTFALKLHYGYDTFTNFTVSNSYLHDVSCALISNAGANNFTLTYNYLSGNGGNSLQHSYAFGDRTDNIISSANVTIAYNYFVNVQGTAAISVFNNASSFPGIASDNNWNIYGNVFSTTGNPDNYALSQWITCFGPAIARVACSHWKIYNNTIDNLSSIAAGSSARVQWVEADPSSTDVEVYNNTWVASNNVNPGVSTGTVCLNATASCASTAQMISDYNYYSLTTGQAVPAEAHIQNTSLTPFVNALLNDFLLTGHTADGLHLSAPFNTDLVGTLRGSGGTWDRGAFQFVSAAPPGGVTLGMQGVH